MGGRGREVNSCRQKRRSLNTKSEFDTDIDVARHLRELHRLLGGGLQVIDGEDLKAGVVELRSELALSRNMLMSESELTSL